jgi:GST-like protein
MLKFYTYNTINGQAIAIALSEMGINHQTIEVDLLKGENRSSEFLKLNPSGRIPVVVDEHGGESTVVSQVGAILIYLAERSGQFIPAKPKERAQVLEWLFFQLTDISVNVFNNFYLKSLVKPNHPEAANVLKQRAISFYQVFDSQLQQHEYVAGDELSIADFASFPVVRRLSESADINSLPNLLRWYQQLTSRPAIKSIYKNT